jgi:hypothetical protein
MPAAIRYGARISLAVMLAGIGGAGVTAPDAVRADPRPPVGAGL